MPAADDAARLRILDANANRAREGLRVAEEYARFALEDASLAARLKALRHEVAEAAASLGGAGGSLLEARDVAGDVGLEREKPPEASPPDARAVALRGLARAGEAARALEEYARPAGPAGARAADRFAAVRYALYEVEPLLAAGGTRRRTLAAARLYVILTPAPGRADLEAIARGALAGGAQVLQHRPKGQGDREALDAARTLAGLCREAGALFIVNDRPDLARLAGADGVHLGQTDLPVAEARRILGPGGLVGVSTHDAGELRRAVRDGADYVGVGAVFASRTKDRAISGLEFVRAASRAAAAGELPVPFFAVGGIGPGNLGEVLAAGATRAAVGEAVFGAADPAAAAAAARALRKALDAAARA